MSDFQSIKLENGLEIIGEQLPGVQSAAVAFFVTHGAVDDDDGNAGLAHLTESTMFRGTARRSSRELTEQLDRIGARYSSSTGLELTLFSGIMLGNHLPEALEIFADVLESAAFPAEELEAVRALQLQEIGQRDDQPQQLVVDLARRRYFAGHPLGHDSLGTLESVTGVARNQVVESWMRWYQPGSTLVAFAGNFDWIAVVEQLRALTEGWTGAGQRWRSSPPEINPAFTVDHLEGAQENLCFSLPGVGYGDPGFYPLALASSILGSGMNSRLFMEVREKRGLAYSVFARFDAMSSTGLVRVFAGTQPERAAESVEVIHSQLRLLEREGVTETELALAKTRLKSRVVMGSESTGNRVMSIGRDWFYERRHRTLTEIRDAIDDVTRIDVAECLDRIGLMENLGLVALGPSSASDLGIESRVGNLAPSRKSGS